MKETLEWVKAAAFVFLGLVIAVPLMLLLLRYFAWMMRVTGLEP